MEMPIGQLRAASAGPRAKAARSYLHPSLFFLSAIFTGRDPKLGLEPPREMRQVREAPGKSNLSDRPMRLPLVFKRAPTPLQAPVKNIAFEGGAIHCQQRVGIADADTGLGCNSRGLEVGLAEAGTR